MMWRMHLVFSSIRMRISPRWWQVVLRSSRQVPERDTHLAVCVCIVSVGIGKDNGGGKVICSVGGMRRL